MSKTRDKEKNRPVDSVAREREETGAKTAEHHSLTDQSNYRPKANKNTRQAEKTSVTTILIINPTKQSEKTHKQTNKLNKQTK